MTPAEFIAGAKHSALHLELRDGYMTSDPWYQAWEAERFEEYEADRGWPNLIRELTGRGVDVRRARVISEPVSEYIRFEHATTPQIVDAGERVRWVPRSRVSRVALPGNDFWLRDGEEALFTFFSGNGEVAGREVTTDPDAVALCAQAFAAVWELGVDHEDYQV